MRWSQYAQGMSCCTVVEIVGGCPNTCMLNQISISVHTDIVLFEKCLRTD